MNTITSHDRLNPSNDRGGAIRRRFLQVGVAELPGYKEFAGQTRFRLLPGVW